MKRLVAIFCIVGFMMPYVFHISQVAWFVVNKSYVVQELCLQRKQENNTCQGACHLKKELSKMESPSTQEDQEPLILTEVEIPVFVVATEISLTVAVEEENTYTAKTLEDTRMGYAQIPETPPEPSFS
jgi:hypothetical protein